MVDGRRRLLFGWVWAWLSCTVACADPVWVVAPGRPGPDLPPQGRSLFDHLTTHDGRQHIPFPFTALLGSIERRLAADGAYLDRPLKQVLIPMGRSLQRAAAAPGFFDSPRVVVAVDSEPAAYPGETGMLLRDRLFIGYLEAADVLEVISYNEDAARFEFQVVRDYRRDGTSQVHYARRVVCTACHQNAAPIFARPLWDETNANTRVAERLAAVGAEFFGHPARTGVDIAYAIDSATDRANGFALTQTLWRQGCGPGAAGAACRATLFSRAVQYALTAGRGFERSSDSYVDALQTTMGTRFARLWPDGLLLPDPDIPNRRPLAGAGLQHAAGQASDAGDLVRLADVAARFEPLAPRPPQALWNPDPEAAAARAVAGIADFLAADDVRRIDDILAELDAQRSTLSANCAAEHQQQATNTRLKLICDGPQIALLGIVYQDDADHRLSGRLRRLDLNGEALGSLSVGGIADQDGTLHIRLTRPAAPGQVRLANGDAVGSVTLRRDPGRSAQARIDLQLRHDFRRLEDTVNRLAGDAAGVFSEAPFVRPRVLSGVFLALGAGDLDWCCTGDTGLAPPVTEQPDVSNGDPLLAPFLQVCAACHRSSEPFPPNFLAGTPDQVLAGIAQCAERIQYRLAMWDVQQDRRTKSPMPPRQAVSLSDAELETWTRGPLLQLRRALSEIAARKQQPLPAQPQATARAYVELRPCMPTT